MAAMCAQLNNKDCCHNKSDTALSDICFLARSYARFDALYCAVELGLFERIKSADFILKELLQEMGVDHDRGSAWIRLLVADGWLKVNSVGQICLSEETKQYLLEESSDSVCNFIKWKHALQVFWATSSVDTLLGKRETIFGSEAYCHLTEKKMLPFFQRAIEEVSGVFIGQFINLLNGIDINLTNKYVVDAGAGSGALSVRLAKAFPDCHFLCVDIDINEAKSNIKKNELTNLIRTQTFDFEKDQFPQADAIIFFMVLSDWPNLSVEKFIANAWSSISREGFVIIVEYLEPVSPNPNAAVLEYLLSMETTGHVRSRREWEHIWGPYCEAQFYDLGHAVEAIIARKNGCYKS